MHANMLEFAAPIRVQMLSWVFCIFKVESVANPAGIRRILVIPLLPCRRIAPTARNNRRRRRRRRRRKQICPPLTSRRQSRVLRTARRKNVTKMQQARTVLNRLDVNQKHAICRLPIYAQRLHSIPNDLLQKTCRRQNARSTSCVPQSLPHHQ